MSNLEFLKEIAIQCACPAFACAGACFFGMLLVACGDVKRIGRSLALLGALLLSAGFFCRVDDSSWFFHAVILTLTGIVAVLVPLACGRRKVTLNTVLLTSGIWCALLFGGFFCLMPFSMHEEVQDVQLSPDGRYRATLSYRDGLTFGYYHVLIEDRRWHGLFAPDEVTEVASEGLTSIRWLAPRTLSVRWNCPEDEFVLRRQRWGSVRVVYEQDNDPPSGG